MTTISQFVKWLEPHAAHFVYVAVATFLSLQVVLGGQTFSLDTQHGAVAFIVAFAVAVWRAFEAAPKAP